MCHKGNAGEEGNEGWDGSSENVQRRSSQQGHCDEMEGLCTKIDAELVRMIQSVIWRVMSSWSSSTEGARLPWMRGKTTQKISHMVFQNKFTILIFHASRIRHGFHEIRGQSLLTTPPLRPVLTFTIDCFLSGFFSKTPSDKTTPTERLNITQQKQTRSLLVKPFKTLFPENTGIRSMTFHLG